MNIDTLTNISTALGAVADSDVPTAKAHVKALLKPLLTDGVEPLRELLEELTESLDSVEQDASELEGAEDREDREAYHDTLVGSVTTLRDQLQELLTPRSVLTPS